VQRNISKWIPKLSEDQKAMPVPYFLLQQTFSPFKLTFKIILKMDFGNGKASNLC